MDFCWTFKGARSRDWISLLGGLWMYREQANLFQTAMAKYRDASRRRVANAATSAIHQLGADTSVWGHKQGLYYWDQGSQLKLATLPLGESSAIFNISSFWQIRPETQYVTVKEEKKGGCWLCAGIWLLTSESSHCGRFIY